MNAYQPSGEIQVGSFSSGPWHFLVRLAHSAAMAQFHCSRTQTPVSARRADQLKSDLTGWSGWATGAATLPIRSIGTALASFRAHHPYTDPNHGGAVAPPPCRAYGGDVPEKWACVTSMTAARPSAPSVKRLDERIGGGQRTPGRTPAGCVVEYLHRPARTSGMRRD